MPEGTDSDDAAPDEPVSPTEPLSSEEPAANEAPIAAPSPPQPARPRGRSRRSKRRNAAVEWGVVVIVALLAAFIVRFFVFETFYIPSGSMEPTLMIGDRIIVSKLSYDFHPVHRGDIIVFHAPAREAAVCADPEVRDLVKRVIGLPGETISSSGNSVLINGKPIAQPWFPATPLGAPITPTKIPSNSYFVMGDNRANSCDSRMWGTLTKSAIIGHVIFRIWPLSQIGIPR